MIYWFNWKNISKKPWFIVRFRKNQRGKAVLIKGNEAEGHKKEILLKLLAEQDVQTLSIAYLYAKNMSEYGADVTKKWETAVEQDEALYRAERRGYTEAYADAKKRFYESLWQGGEMGDKS